MSAPEGRTVPGNRWDLLDGVWPADPPLVSVVIAHYRQQAQLDRTLAALARQTYPADRLEVLVVDDGSPEPPRVPDGVRLLCQAKRGFRAAAARNRGAREARGTVLCFLDADTAPEPEYVRELTRLPAIAPEAVCVGRRAHADLSATTGPVETAGPAAALPAPAWLADGYAATRELLDADDRSYRFVISAVLACSRWFFTVAGPFDESFEEYGGEDWEWAARAWRAGGILAHVPRAVAWHDGADWSGRTEDPGARRVAKNRETLRLASLIRVPGSRARALWGGLPDVVIELPTVAASPAATFVCVDSLLAELPEAAVVVADAGFTTDPRVVTEPPGGARLVVTLARLLRVRGGALRTAVERGGDAPLVLCGPDGAELLRIVPQRAAARIARWGDATLFPVVREGAEGLEPIDGEPDLEAYLGGWE